MHARMIASVVAATFASAISCAGAMPACRVLSNGISFGDTDALRPEVRSSVGLVTVVCQGEGEALVTIGLQAGGQSAQRHRFDSRSRAPTFALYLDPAHQLAWGDGTGGTATIQRKMRGDGQIEQIPVYAELSVDQADTPGNYASTLALLLQVDEAGPR